MNTALHNLARRGEINWISAQFGEFVKARASDGASGFVEAIATLLSEQALHGNVCLDLSKLTTHSWFVDLITEENSDIPIQPDDLPGIRTILLENPLIKESDPEAVIVLEDHLLYLNRYWWFEETVAQQIHARNQPLDQLEDSKLQTALAALFPHDDEADQRAAAEKAARYRFTVISGGPGTGKTTTVVRILSLLSTLNPNTRVALAAPTGKAAARMMASIEDNAKNLALSYQSLPNEAYTIHRLLGLRQGQFEFHRDHPLPFDCIVIDEASMIDLALMFHLLDACAPNCRIILLGDRDQLASVAAGNVLGDITGHGLPPSANTLKLDQSIALLQRSRRFDQDSGIAKLARLVNEGNFDDSMRLLRDELQDIRYVVDSDNQPSTDLMNEIIDHYAAIVRAESAEQALDLFDQLRVLCASNKGPCGVDSINSQISKHLLTVSPASNGTLFHGLPVMVTKNHRETRLFNGDTGVIRCEDQLWLACFRDQQGSIRKIPVNRLPAFVSAWASTVHKSQGSEYDAVILFISEENEPRLLCRELLYTAVTRSRERFILHGSEHAVEQSISQVTRRASGLAHRLGWPENA